MPGHVIVTQAPAETVQQTLLGAASQMGYGVDIGNPWQPRLTQGNLALSIFLGAFIAYCDFQASISQPGDGTTHLRIDRNVPWWTGVIGVHRVKNQHHKLHEAIAQSLGAQGFPILHRQDV